MESKDVGTVDFCHFINEETEAQNNFLIQGQSQRGQILEPESTKVFATGEVHAM